MYRSMYSSNVIMERTPVWYKNNDVAAKYIRDMTVITLLQHVFWKNSLNFCFQDKTSTTRYISSSPFWIPSVPPSSRTTTPNSCYPVSPGSITRCIASAWRAVSTWRWPQPLRGTWQSARPTTTTKWTWPAKCGTSITLYPLLWRLPQSMFRGFSSLNTHGGKHIFPVSCISGMLHVIPFRSENWWVTR